MRFFNRFLRPFVERIRRNHGLEHATIHVLTQRNPYLSLVGYSDWRGFSIYGQVETEQLQQAVQEALARLRAGERHLAIHHRCGTVLATTGILSGLAAFLVMGLSPSKSRFRWSSLPDALTAATAAVVLAQPIGLLLQQHVTTTGDVGNLKIGRIYREDRTSVPLHRIETR